MNFLLRDSAFAGAVFFLIAGALGALFARLPLPTNATERFRALDGLRGFLALSVVLHHSWLWIGCARFALPWAAPSANFANQLGAGAVAMFFMTTGFLFYPRTIAGLSGTHWPAFVLQRVFRIIPLVAFSTAIVTIIAISRTGHHLSVRDFIPILRWISSLGEPTIAGYEDSGRLNAYVLWSLRWEWIFYVILLPICAFASSLGRKIGLPTWLMPCCMLGTMVALRLLMSLTHHQFQFLRYAPLFTIGMLAYEAQSQKLLAERLRSRTATVLAIASLLVAMLLTNTPYGLSLPLFAFFFICVACGNGMGGLLTTPAARVLGECSFGIYLMHGIILDLAFTEGGLGDASRFSLHSVGVLIAGLPLVIVPVAVAGWLLIERPFIRFGKRTSALLIGGG